MQDKNQLGNIIRLSANPDGFGTTADELTTDMFTSDLPTQHTHLYINNEDQGLYVGVWDTDDMSESPGAYPCDEFMVLLEGEARIKNNATGEIDTVHAGEAFVLPKGFDCQWIQQGYLKKFFLISEHPAEVIPETPSHSGVIVLKGADKSLDQSNSERENIVYTDNLSRFTAGTWRGAAYRSPMSAFAVNQLCYVHSGSITLTESNTQAQTFVAGDAFYIPADVEHSADVDDRAVLFFCRLNK